MLPPSCFRFTLVLLLCSFPLIAAENSQHKQALKSAIAKQLIELNVSDSGQLSEDDLSLFAKKLNGARIVGLGEQTHGAGSVFKLKTQLIKYLHKHHNYDLFILESGMYDVKKLWEKMKQGQRLKSLAPGNIFYMYANSDEVTPLFDYIDQQANGSTPLTLVGFDSQHTGSYSNKNLVDELQLALKALPEPLHNSTSWAQFKENLQHVLNTSTKRLPSQQEQEFFEQLSAIAQQFLKYSSLNNRVLEQNLNEKIAKDNATNNGFWYRITKGLAAQAKRQWQIADNRSQEMGENIKWWAEQYPNKKIIVWAHTWHLTKAGNNQINAGNVVSNAFGKNYYMIHFTGASGDYLDYGTLKEQALDSPSLLSIETIAVNNSKADIEFLNVSDINTKNNPINVFSNDYQQVLSANEWPKYWDGIFIINKIKPASYHAK